MYSRIILINLIEGVHYFLRHLLYSFYLCGRKNLGFLSLESKKGIYLIIFLTSLNAIFIKIPVFVYRKIPVVKGLFTWAYNRGGGGGGGLITVEDFLFAENGK